MGKKYACRVCDCTEDNACVGGCTGAEKRVGAPPICSACAGTAGDMLESLRRGERFLSKLTNPDIAAAIAVSRAAVARRNARLRLLRDG